MADSCLLYYITDRTAFAPDEPTRRRRLLEKIAEAARAGVSYIQLREKDLSTRELELLAQDAVHSVRETCELNTDHWPPTAILINSRCDVALAAGADGVHLRSDDVSPEDVRTIWETSHAGTAAIGCPAPRGATETGVKSGPVIGVSCHSPEEVQRAHASGATFAVFAPVFEKRDNPGAPPAGRVQLRDACKVKMAVLALGGVTLENAKSCLEAGAAGIAAIRLFQENDIAEVLAQLRNSL